MAHIAQTTQLTQNAIDIRKLVIYAPLSGCTFNMKHTRYRNIIASIRGDKARFYEIIRLMSETNIQNISDISGTLFIDAVASYSSLTTIIGIRFNEAIIQMIKLGFRLTYTAFVELFQQYELGAIYLFTENGYDLKTVNVQDNCTLIDYINRYFDGDRKYYYKVTAINKHLEAKGKTYKINPVPKPEPKPEPEPVQFIDVSTQTSPQSSRSSSPTYERYCDNYDSD